MSYSVKPIIRDDKPVKINGLYPINLLVRIDKTQIKIPTNYEVSKDLFDKKSGMIEKGYPNYALINSNLEKKKYDFLAYINKLELTGQEITREMVKDFFKGTPRKSFLEFFKEQIDLWTPQLAYGTMKVYNSTYKILTEYKRKINFNEVNLNFIESFNKYLIEERGNTDGGLYNRNKNLRTIIKVAIRSGYMDRNPYDYFKIKKTNGRKTYLTLEEVKEFINYDIPERRQALFVTRDMFLFTCYTGLRFSDLMNVKFGNINNNQLKIRILKTGKDLELKLIPPALEIIEIQKERTGGKRNENVFKAISNQKANKNLQDIQGLMELKKKLTFHVGRHTFASNLVELGMPLNIVKEHLGHASIKETEVYAKLTKDKVFNSLDVLGEAHG